MAKFVASVFLTKVFSAAVNLFFAIRPSFFIRVNAYSEVIEVFEMPPSCALLNSNDLIKIFTKTNNRFFVIRPPSFIILLAASFKSFSSVILASELLNSVIIV